MGRYIMNELTRRSFLGHVALAALGACLPRRGLSDTLAARPNIILCMTDDQGWGDTGYNGHPVLRTPHLDAMAREGLRFERFYSGAPVCSPTRGSCITGRHPYRYGIFSANVGHIPAEEITLAEAVKPLGYATGHFGKWHLGTMTVASRDANRGAPGNTADYAPPWEHGFDSCFSTEAKVPTWWHEGDYESYGTHYWSGPEEKIPAAEILGDDSTLLMERALRFIRNAAEKNTPFLAVIWFHASHLPVVSAPPYTDGYEEHQDFYGCLTAMDAQMGRLRETLGNLGIAENTMLWFCSDNGPEGNDSAPGRTGGLRGRKRSLYEGGVRVPGLLVWPEKVKTNRVVEMPCRTSDYFPTVMEALGFPLPEFQARPHDGVSLMPLIEDTMNTRPKPIGFESAGYVSLTDNRYKIIGKEGGPYELYDLVEDMEESKDLAGEHPEIVRQMQETLEAWRRSCKDSLNGNDY